MRFLFSIVLFFATMLNCLTQELNCDVKVTYENVQQTDPATFRALEEKILLFLNETKWTEDQFSPEERIDCSFYLNIQQELNQNQFAATATIKSSRPAYNSTYNTVMLDVIDNDFVFEFDPFTILEFRENEFSNNLTASLAFYAYTIIGFDYDSFSSLGGSIYHNLAQDIVRQAATSTSPGWTQANTNNRGKISKYWISENLMSSRAEAFRKAYYQYHRNVIDQMYDEPREALSNLTGVIDQLHAFYKQNRNSQILYIFFDAKGDEIVNLMAKANSADKRKVGQLSQEMDPMNTKKYKRLLK